MILWVDGAHDAPENMRRDRELLRAVEEGAEPVLRLFQFAPHGITLGASQRPERELDLERCAADRIAWAVRPTGGRAIFHAQEWTYSLAASIHDPDWGGSQAEAYGRMSRRIAASLARLGVPAALARGRGSRSAPERLPGLPAAPCFASAARHEVVLDGRKLVGSAQRRTRNALLQQGSLLLGDGHLRLVDYLALPEERRRPMREALALATRHAGRWLGGKAELSAWADALEADFPPGARRLTDASDAFLLTLRNRASYTAR